MSDKDSPDRTTPQTDEPRLGIVVGDRTCIRCHYNLVGQAIVREPHYDLPVVRCPECGTVASLQEYPLLGRWATRWGLFLAGIWMVVVLAVMLAIPGVLLGLTYGVTQSTTMQFLRFLGQEQEEWITRTEFDISQSPTQIWGTSSQPGQYYWHTLVIDEWWDQADAGALVAKFGGYRRMFNAQTLVGWLWLWVPIMLMSMPIALLLPHVRRRWLPLAAAGLIGITAFYWVVGVMFDSDQTYLVPTYLGDLAQRLGGRYVWLSLILLSAIPVLIGVMIGRSIARMMVRALLPPRLRSALAGLWLIDGLEPPRASPPCKLTASR